MFFPIGDDQIRGGAYPIFCYTFLALNCLVFLYQVSLSPAALQHFVYTHSTIPVDILAGNHFITLITSMFLHGSWMHLLSNMLFLWVFGDNVEATVGNGRFLIFYLIGGLMASLGHVVLNPLSEIPSLGASGAIAAIMGGYLVMFPSSRVKVFLFLLIIIRRISMPAVLFLGLWIVMQLASGLQNIGIDAQESGTAWWAHIGGFAVGLIFGALHRSQAQRYQLG